jgi:hypothetical protein
MLATYVHPETTALTFDLAALAMRAALIETLGQDPAAPTLALALAKTALETGRWSSMWCFNFGNIKCSDKWGGLFTCVTLNEVIDGKVMWFSPLGRLTGNPSKGGRLAGDVADTGRKVPPGHPQTRLRAFAEASEGALNYVQFVSGGRYAAAWARLLVGDGAGYVHELKRAGYFTADEEQYARGVLSLQREFIAKLAALPAEPASVPPVEDVRAWLAPQDIAALETELAERYFDLLDDNRKSALREMSDDDDSKPPPSIA